MKIRVAFILFLMACVPRNLLGQIINLNDLGIWRSNSDTSTFYIYKKDSLLIFGFNSKDKSYLINKRKVGFVKLEDVKKVAIKDGVKLDSSQNIFNSIGFGYELNQEVAVNSSGNPETDVFFYNNILVGFEIQFPIQIGSNYEIINSNVSSYAKVQSLPKAYINKLYHVGQLDKYDYLKEFLWVDFKRVKPTKLFLHSSPALKYKTQTYLTQGDPVEILKEEEDWLKIRHYPEKDGEWTGETIEGWIRKEDVE